VVITLQALDPGVRWRAAAILGKLGDRRAVSPLIQVLRDENPSVRGWAVEALGLLGDEQALSALEALCHDETRVPYLGKIADLAWVAARRIQGDTGDQPSPPA
jgi:HEAT repeat protein